MVEPLLQCLFPARCHGCRKRGDGWMCAACREAVTPVPAAACPRCDLPGGVPVCPDCRALDFRFAGARAVGVYEGVLRRAVLVLKRGSGWRVADALADLMEHRVRGAWPAVRFDCVTAVPLEEATLRLRGYNQAELLASRMAVRLHVPHRRGLLRRETTGIRQSRLTDADRREHARRAYRAGEVPAGARVLLVDDVMTTGATLAACSEHLIERGCEVWCIVVARAPRFGSPRFETLAKPIRGNAA